MLNGLGMGWNSWMCVRVRCWLICWCVWMGFKMVLKGLERYCGGLKIVWMGSVSWLICGEFSIGGVMDGLVRVLSMDICWWMVLSKMGGWGCFWRMLCMS